jgi:hypothetical protein
MKISISKEIIGNKCLFSGERIFCWGCGACGAGEDADI